MGRLHSLYGKVAGIFLVLLLVLGAAQWLVSLRAYMSFAAETEQKLNHHLARDLAERFSPFLKDSLDYAAIEHTFHELMVMNPRVEIYLLDAGGQVLAYFAEPEKIVRHAVDVGPIRRFVEEEGSLPLPLYGDDPRGLDRQKPFSATPVLIGGRQPGYLYVILAGEQYESVASMLEDSYIGQTSAVVLGGVFLFTGLAGLLLFFLLTKRLRAMTAVVRRFEEGDYRQRVRVDSADELGQLGRAFNQMADTLVANLQEIERKDALRRELVANVSHDLRTPLANVQGYLETVLMKEAGLDAEERRRFLDIIHHNVTMLGRLVNELFELSKLEARQSEPESEPFSLAELVQDIALDFQPRAEEDGVHLRTHFAQDLPFVRGDIGMIERALTKLIENALQYTPSGGRVEVGLARAGDAVRAVVEDTGRGIPARDLPHIFDRFYRVDKNRSTRSGGTGLGLAIAQKIVQAHGGVIEVESEEGAGTRFVFALPVYEDARVVAGAAG